jgi:hypothetical protein
MHDCCGTIAGITLFQAHVTRLIAFAQICARLRRDNLRMHLPLNEWVNDASCPAYFREFWAQLAWSVQTGHVFTGRVDFPVGGRPPFEVYTDIEPFPGRRLPATGIAAEDSAQGDPNAASREAASFVVPVGFEHLIEGTAWALQDAYLDLWPLEVADRVKRRFKAEFLRPSQPHTDDFYAYPPYDVTDRLLRRYLSARGVVGIPA